MDAHLIDAVAHAVRSLPRRALGVRTDDLAAAPDRRAAPAATPVSTRPRSTTCYYGNANGSGEDNRNVGRMAALLAGLPDDRARRHRQPLCASGGEAIVQGARAVATGDAHLVLAGGVEGMSRAPYVVPQPDEALPRSMEILPDRAGLADGQPEVPAGVDRPARCLRRACRGVLRRRPAGRTTGRCAATYAPPAAWDKGLHDVDVAAVGDVVRDESIRATRPRSSWPRCRPRSAPAGTVPPATPRR